MKPETKDRLERARELRNAAQRRFEAKRTRWTWRALRIVRGVVRLPGAVWRLYREASADET